MVLIFDLESAHPDGKINVENAIFKTIAFYEYETDKYSFYTYEQKDEIIKVFQKHRVIIGFNSESFDIPILKRFGAFKFKHTHIDLYQVLKKRGAYIGLKYVSKSLSNIAKVLKLKNYKDDDFDYSILNKEAWTPEELEYIKTYNILDIKVTKDLYERIKEFFEPFKEFVSKYDQREMKWMKCSMASFAYKTICNKTGIKEEYEDGVEGISYEGAIVYEPTCSEEHYDIVAYDYKSLYPHNNIQGNLYSYKCKCCSQEEKWHGNDLFPVVGYYCTKHQGKIEKALKEIYILRQKYKKIGDPRQKALKIVLNSFYGASAKPVFKNIYNQNTVSDCTLIGRKCIELSHKMFGDAGYKILYGDTDSIYVKDPFKNRERLTKIKDQIVQKIKDNLPFPSETFDMGLDDEIKHIYFFKTSDRFAKKNYMYVKEDDELIIKGMTMIRGDSSKIGFELFNKHMRELVIKGQIKFDYYDILKWATQYLEENPNSAIRTWGVNEASTYKLDSQLQAQIAKRYGPGRHLLMPNDTFGVGNSTKYCTLEEFKEQKLGTSNIVLDKMWKELSYFCEIPKKERKSNQHKMRKQKTSLLKWFGV